VRMFGPLPMPAIDELALHLDRVDYSVGEHVFREGDDGDHLYVINTGEADVIAAGSVIATMHRGEVFGEIALLHDTVRTTSIRARTALELYTLDRSHFLAAMAGYASGARAADELVAERLAELDTRR